MQALCFGEGGRTMVIGCFGLHGASAQGEIGRRGESLLQLSLRLPYEPVRQSSQDEVRFIMLEAFLATLEHLVPDLGIENFDREGFLADLRGALM